MRMEAIEKIGLRRNHFGKSPGIEVSTPVLTESVTVLISTDVTAVAPVLTSL